MALPAKEGDNSPTMLSPGDIAFLKSEIAQLEKARMECSDNGIRKQIEAWIDGNKKKLHSGEIQSSPRKPPSKSDESPCAD
jgi:hypothetical protein